MEFTLYFHTPLGKLYAKSNICFVLRGTLILIELLAFQGGHLLAFFVPKRSSDLMPHKYKLLNWWPG